MPISPARRIAFEVLCRVSSQGAYASELLHTRLTDRISRADAALSTELTLGVLRWQRLLDFLLGRNLDRALERLDSEVLIALRLGLYQLRFLERVPAHAAVDQSVELVKRARKYSAAGLVNAVLRRTAPEAKVSGKTLPALLPAEASLAERWGILHSHPTWLVERWLARFGKDRCLMLLEANNRPARLSCAVLDAGNVAAVEESLRAGGFEGLPGRWLQTALALSGGNLTTAEAFRKGQITLQDEASQMVAHLVDARPGQIALDLCSAPGGKTLLMARAVGASGMVIAADLYDHRLRSVREQLSRTGTENVVLLALNATGPLPFHKQFARILVDAPCSGTGTLARNPEIRWRLEPQDLSDAHFRQTGMLRQALALLAPGGRLLYATCSLEPEENEEVVRDALSENATVRVVPGAADALLSHLRQGVPAPSLFDRDGFFRTFPPESGTDGFFAAALERTA
jgi:16S rRNA (cytosine967-C5)-methyltransferase